MELQLDTTSWTAPAKPPAELVNLVGPVSLDVGKTLLNIGLRTRPPGAAGIHLADYWAWLRYFPAVADGQDLALRSMWRVLDPHQKTILSDDWGVGVATGVLGQALDIQAWGDARHVIRICGPTLGKLASTNKQGAGKSPDFIGGSAAWEFAVLECKGTQTSRANLLQQLERGRAQKLSLTLDPSVNSLGGFVGGIFVPIESGKEKAAIRFRDPPVVDRTANGEQAEPLAAAVAQSELASHLQLCGLVELAERFEASTLARPLEIPPRRDPRVFPFVQRWEDRDGAWLGLQHHFPLRRTPGGAGPVGVTVRIGVKESVVETIHRARNVREAASRVLAEASPGAARFVSPGRVETERLGDRYVEAADGMPAGESLETPLGVRLEVTWIGSP